MACLPAQGSLDVGAWIRRLGVGAEASSSVSTGLLLISIVAGGLEGLKMELRLLALGRSAVTPLGTAGGEMALSGAGPGDGGSSLGGGAERAVGRPSAAYGVSMV